jgi:hypothetical protein
MPFTLHCTQKLLDKIKPSIIEIEGQSTTTLGAWYATLITGRPQLVLLVNEKTLLPVLMLMAPAKTLALRFPIQLAQVLLELGVTQAVIYAELVQMRHMSVAKTKNRSVVGIMSEYSYMADVFNDGQNLVELSLRLAEVPCSPLYKTTNTPANAMRELLHPH